LVVEIHQISRGNLGQEPATCDEFRGLLKSQDPWVLKNLGIEYTDPLEWLRKYDAASTIGEMTSNPNASVGNQKNSRNRASEMASPWLKLRGLDELWSWGKEVFGKDFSLDPVFSGKLYIHKLSKLDRPYCVGASCLDIMQDGRPYADIVGKPPKHFSSFMGQMFEYVLNMVGDWSGAIAVSDWMPGMAYYVRKEKVPDTAIRQEWQAIVHKFHNKWREDGDPPFTNTSFNSPSVLEDIFKTAVFPDGSNVLDYKDEIMHVQDVLLQFMAEGDPSKAGIQYKFPVMTANFKPEDIGSPWWEKVARKNNEGFLNICHAAMFASCCRLLSDYRTMLKMKQYSNGGGGIKTGSHMVVALNLPGIAKSTKGWSEFMDELGVMIDHAVRYLYIHKHFILGRRIKDAYNPFLAKFRDDAGDVLDVGPWMHLNMFFSTIGVHGVPEMVQEFGEDVTEKHGARLAERVLTYIVNRANDYSKQFTENVGDDGIIMVFNVEQIPAESASHTMASFFGDEMYSNQFVPLDQPIDIWKRVEIEGRLSKILTGGSMTFLHLGSAMDPDQSLLFHKRVMQRSGGNLNQFCVDYGFSLCKKCNTKVVGRIEKCSCGRPMRHYQRVVGYMVPESSVNRPRVVNDIRKRLGYEHW